MAGPPQLRTDTVLAAAPRLLAMRISDKLLSLVPLQIRGLVLRIGCGV